MQQFRNLLFNTIFDILIFFFKYYLSIYLTDSIIYKVGTDMKNWCFTL